MSKPKTKRFYKSVSLKDVETGWGVYLDDHLLKTPGKLSLIAQSKAHADLIASEWDAQDTIIKPHLMPVTRLYKVALERTPENRDALIAEVKKYAGTDLLCYRTEFPRVLAERQAAAWDDWLEWAHGIGIELKTAIGINAVEQPPEALESVGNIASKFDDLKLTLLAHLNAVYGSAILALAVVKGELPADKAYDLSRLDFEFQAERWGEDEEARELSKVTRTEVIALSKLL
jgi:chaperone required for assembly of F1-ATPase